MNKPNLSPNPIPGLLERLGDTTIKKILLKNKKEQENQRNKEIRNQLRKNLVKETKTFIAYLDSYGEKIEISSRDVDVSKILDLENQIEP